jgi:hypothetical protein
MTKTNEKNPKDHNGRGKKLVKDQNKGVISSNAGAKASQAVHKKHNSLGDGPKKTAHKRVK